MTKKGSDSITITLDKKIVKILRAKKRGTETWDDLMRRLSRRMNCGLECMICGEWLETDETDVSVRDLAERHGWIGAYTQKGGMEAEKWKSWAELGYICGRCGRKRGK